MESSFDFQQLQSAVQALYHLKPDSVFTMKWIDDEGDPCMLTSDTELKEALRLYQINKEPSLAVHGKSSISLSLLVTNIDFISHFHVILLAYFVANKLLNSSSFV